MMTAHVLPCASPKCGAAQRIHLPADMAPADVTARLERAAGDHGWRPIPRRGLRLVAPDAQAAPHLARALSSSTTGGAAPLPRAIVVGCPPCTYWLLADGLDAAALEVHAAALVALCRARGWTFADDDVPASGWACSVGHLGDAIEFHSSNPPKESDR
jgi:hypothetical protein